MLKNIIKAFTFLNRSKENDSFDFGLTQKDIETQLNLTN